MAVPRLHFNLDISKNRVLRSIAGLGIVLCLIHVILKPSHVQIKTESVAGRDTDTARTIQDLARRRESVSEACARGIGVTKSIDTRYQMMDAAHGLAMCRVAKTASTFWLRFFYQLANTDPMQSPYDVKTSVAYRHESQFQIHPSQLSEFQAMSTRLLFVREPFSRLFSAFVDKLLPPNPVYWRIWGLKAISRFRPKSARKSPKTKGGRLQTECGDDVTFSEFVSFAVAMGNKYDNHLMPIYRLCSPCANNFTVVGKMETFERDAKHVASLLGIPETQIRFEKMNADKREDAIWDSTGGTFSDAWLKSTLKCVTREGAAQRVWRKLQIRGFISWRQRLKLTEVQKSTLGMRELQEMLSTAQSLSTNGTELKMQKRLAFIEAFSSLHPAQIRNIVNVFANDFELFGYSTSLVESLLTEYSHSQNTGAFRWDTHWDLTGM